MEPAPRTRQRDQPGHHHHAPGPRRADRAQRRGLPPDAVAVTRRPRRTPDEVATVAALLMGPDGAFITGTDVLMDGGVTASYFYGDLAPQ